MAVTERPGPVPINPRLEPYIEMGGNKLSVGPWKIKPCNTLTALLWAFGRCRALCMPVADTEYYFWRVADILWNYDDDPAHHKFVRNPWSEKMIREAITERYLAVGGAASSTKSHSFAGWGIINWLCNPAKTQVAITSISLKEAKERSEKSDEKAYAKALEEADKVQKKIDEMWAKVEAQRAEDRAKAYAEINRMKMQIEEERKTKVLLIFAGVGGLITLAGVALFIFGSKPNAVGLIAIGAGIGSLGFFWGSPAFDLLMIVLIGLSGLMGLIWLGKRIFAKAQ